MANRKDSKGRVLKSGESERKDGRYSYRYIGLEGSRKTVYAANLNDLRVKEKQIQKDLEMGTYSKAVSMNECYDRYLATKSGLKESTLVAYSENYNRWVRNTWFGHKNIKDIKKSDVLLFYKEKANTLSGNTIKGISNLINQALEMAVDDYLISRNPAHNCAKEFRKNPPRQSIPENELSAFLEYAEKSSYRPHFLTISKFMLSTGLRVGEAAGLTWDDIDFVQKTISVDKQMLYRKRNSAGNGFFISTPKTNAGVRQVPITDQLEKLLKAHMESTYFFSMNSGVVIDGYKGFVFVTHRGTPLTVCGLNAYLDKMVKEYNKQNEVPISKITSHLFRHTFCTRAAERGLTPKALQYIMGHERYETTANIYITKDASFAKQEFLRVMND